MPRGVVHTAGEAFGLLTVVSRAPVDASRSDKAALWLCRCACGNTALVTGRRLRNGGSRSCGCVGRPDLAGAVFGRLTVKARAGADHARKSLWLCECSCGSQVKVLGNSLSTGNTTSCGCAPKGTPAPGIAGIRFGRLTAVELHPVRAGNGGARWRCACECGKRSIVTADALRGGKTVSCGCAKQGAAPSRSADTRDKVRVRVQARRARKLGAAGSFTAREVADLYARQSGRCAEPTCRVPLGREFNRDHVTPLVLGGSNDIRNIQLLCTPCNLKKHAKHPLDWAREHGRLL